MSAIRIFNNKMRLTLFTCLLLSLSYTVYGQEITSGTVHIFYKEIKGDEIRTYLDSLRNKHVQDTLSFSRKNLVHRADGTRNTIVNSPLYVVDGKFLYKLDIISGSQVTEFINEVFEPGKIKVIL